MSPVSKNVFHGGAPRVSPPTSARTTRASERWRNCVLALLYGALIVPLGVMACSREGDASRDPDRSLTAHSSSAIRDGDSARGSVEAPDSHAGHDHAHAGDRGHNQGVADQSSPASVTLPPGDSWCEEHGVPESMCTRCNPTLVAEFQERGDWCAEHAVPESQCVRCDPDVRERVAALRTSLASAKPSASATLPPGDSWCEEHGVPESMCTRCNPTLVAEFQERGDWCAEHAVPESQCVRCNPDVRGQLAALRASLTGARLLTSPVAAQSAVTGIRVEPAGSAPRGNDPLCAVDQQRVRFVDRTVLNKAGLVVEPVALRRISAAIECPAEVRYDERRKAHVTPRVPGVIREVFVQQGDSVAAGEPMCIIDSPALGEAKSRYMEALANHALAEADLARVSVVYDGVQKLLTACRADASGTDIQRELADVIVGEAKSRLLAGHAELELARSEMARQVQLRESGAGTEREFEKARAAVFSTEAAFFAAREDLAQRHERELLVARKALNVARTALESAERSLHIYGLPHESIRSVTTGEDERITRYELLAPIDGRVVEHHAVMGEAVSEESAIFTVADLRTYWLVINVREHDLAKLRMDMPVLFTVDGLPGERFESVIDWTSSEVDDRTRSVRARATLANLDGTLRANMFGVARLIIHDNAERPTVPFEAVQTDGCCQLVFVRESDTVFRARKVTLGARVNDVVEVIGGASPGEAVVSTGSFLLKTEILKSQIGAGCCEVEPGR